MVDAAVVTKSSKTDKSTKASKVATTDKTAKAVNDDSSDTRMVFSRARWDAAKAKAKASTQTKQKSEASEESKYASVRKTIESRMIFDTSNGT